MFMLMITPVNNGVMFYCGQTTSTGENQKMYMFSYVYILMGVNVR